MSNVIHITAADNELIIKAFQWNTSYEVCTIKSGNYNTVDVTIDIDDGPYGGPVHLNGVNNPLNYTGKVHLPEGTYCLAIVGINWGGPSDFKFKFNDEEYHSEPTDEKGPVWCKATDTFKVQKKPRT